MKGAAFSFAVLCFLIDGVAGQSKLFGDYNDDTRVFTYANFGLNSRALNNTRGTVDVFSTWAASWARHGWKPFVLTDADAKTDPQYFEFIARASSLADGVANARAEAKNIDLTRRTHLAVKRVGFRLRGITQFFAKSVVGAGMLTDSDVINYGLTPQDVRNAVRSKGTKALPEHENPPDFLSDAVFIHDGRKCRLSTESGIDLNSGRYKIEKDKMLHGKVIDCVKLNNGLTSGNGAAYRKMVDGMLKLQEMVLGSNSSDSKPSDLTEMRMVNTLAEQGTNVAVPLLLGVTFQADTMCWQHAKCVHFYGSGIKNWYSRHCLPGDSSFQQRDEVLCYLAKRNDARAAFIRRLRDPF